MKRPRGRRKTRIPVRWTTDEVRALTSSWGEFSARAISRRLRPRTWTAIRKKAYELGLSARPQGMIAISALAQRCGVEYATMLRVIEWAGVKRQASYPSPRPGAHEPRAIHWTWVDELEGVEAFERWLRAERVAEASARLGQPRMRLWYRARAEGLGLDRRSVLRLDPEVWDRLAARPLYGRSR